MNVFEDLIEELRDENLLEETVIDIPRSRHSETGMAAAPTLSAEVRKATVDAPEDETNNEPESESDFYRKRAMDEVSSLQMVEHVIGGIEREHMKAIPASYDDLEAKKSLHKFLQIQSDPDSAEYAEAEFKLMHEMEAWNTALSLRDREISVSNLRRFCENSRPALSSQALLALGRFYRNSAYSELSRAKFDLVMTRLFSRETGDERRRLLFSRGDSTGHLKNLYASWSSVALYSDEEASLRARAVIAGFEERMAEAEAAKTFEQLVKDGLFAKVHEFKEATGELFFMPEVVAVSIECNVRIGNKFVDLIEAERGALNPETVESRYGLEYDQIISEAAGKTLQLVELLKSLPEVPAGAEAPEIPEPKAEKSATKKKERAPFVSGDMFRVNKWLLLLTIIAVAASAGLYFWSNKDSGDVSSAQQASTIDLDRAGLGEHLRNGRATRETLYAVTLPSWDQLSEDQKREVAKKALDFAGQNKLKRVNLVSTSGDAKAFAAEGRLDIYNPIP